MTNLQFDSLAAFVLLATAFIGAYAPVVLAKWGTAQGGPGHRSKIYVLGNMLSAGVMLSAGFVHLLGESVMELEDVTSFPLATFLCGVGFLITLLADSVMEALSSHGNAPGTPRPAALCCGSVPVVVPEVSTPLHQISIVAEGQSHSQRHRRGQDSASPSLELGWLSHKQEGAGKHLSVEESSPSQSRLNADHLRLRNPLRQPELVEESGSSREGSPRSPATLMPRSSPRSIDIDRSRRRAGQHLQSPNQATDASAATMSTHFGQQLHAEQEEDQTEGASDEDASGHQQLLGHQNHSSSIEGTDHSHQSPTEPVKSSNSVIQVSFLTAALMAVALCVHSVLEGMALGAQREIAKTFHIFVAILAHKGLAAYALGSSIVDSNASMEKYWTVICLFAFATPAGIFAGFLLANVSETDGAAAISSLASGTFLYVALMEVIPRELTNMDHRALKLTMLVAGFGAMSLLAIWA